MIALVSAALAADPVAARLPPVDGLEVAAALRTDGAGSAVVWDGARGAGLTASVSHLGGFVGLRRTGDGVRAGVTAGLAAPLAGGPAVAITACPWVGFGRSGARALWTVALAAPAAVRVPDAKVEVPLLLEAGAGVRVGAVRIAAGVDGGAVFGSGPPGLAGGLWLSAAWARP